MDNNFNIDLREKMIVTPVIKAEVKRLENYLLDNESKRAANLEKGKDNARLWANYYDAKNELDALNIFLTKLIKTTAR